jgi:hypothetical protein
LSWYKQSHTGITRLWLDDIRPMPAGYNSHAITAQDAIAVLQGGSVEAISLDHDLGSELGAGDGYQVAKYIEEHAYSGDLKRIPDIKIHSANPVGAQNMLAAIKNAQKFWDKHEQNELE